MTFDEWREMVLAATRDQYTDGDQRWDPTCVLRLHGRDGIEHVVDINLMLNSDHAKEILTDLTIPALIARFEATYGGLILNTWAIDHRKLSSELTPNERQAIERVMREGGIASLPRHLRVEWCLVQLCDGQAEDLYFASIERDRRRGTWLGEWSRVGDEPGAEVKGRFTTALARGFALAVGVEEIIKLVREQVPDLDEHLAELERQRRRARASRLN